LATYIGSPWISILELVEEMLAKMKRGTTYSRF